MIITKKQKLPKGYKYIYSLKEFKSIFKDYIYRFGKITYESISHTEIKPGKSIKHFGRVSRGRINDEWKFDIALSGIRESSFISDENYCDLQKKVKSKIIKWIADTNKLIIVPPKYTKHLMLQFSCRNEKLEFHYYETS